MFRERILRIPQPVRFVISGGTVFVFVTLTTLVLSFLGLDIQIAIPAGFCAGLVLQFNLQRHFVFANHEAFHLGVAEQLLRYLPAAAIQYVIVAGLTAILPGALGVNERVVYLVVVFFGAVASFLFSRAFIFHGGSGTGGAELAGDEPLR